MGPPQAGVGYAGFGPGPGGPPPHGHPPGPPMGYPGAGGDQVTTTQVCDEMENLTLTDT
jgi:hypothetical protein